MSFLDKRLKIDVRRTYHPGIDRYRFGMHRRGKNHLPRADRERDPSLGRLTPSIEQRRNGSIERNGGDGQQGNGDHWRVVRARNKWQPAEDCARHPVPGTYPVVITGDAEWGGWRVPGAEYDLDPSKVEMQARLIASAPQLAAFAGGLVDWARKSGEDMPNALVELAHDAQDILAHVKGLS